MPQDKRNICKIAREARGLTQEAALAVKCARQGGA